ncbi:MAG: hypothetical protein IKB02_01430 [Clostridia bacterium]|nr:hypothetical protein [Clostridia bacterium]
MKKILALVLALTMIVGMSIPAFAAEITESGDKATVGDTVTITVSGTVNDSGDNVYGTTYSVVVEWDSMTFEYTSEKEVYTWDAENLEYVKDTSQSVTAHWDKSEAEITVTNRSNAKVYVTATITGDVFEVTSSAEVAACTEDTTEQTLPSEKLYVRPVKAIEAPVTATVTLTISDQAPANS